MNAGQASDDLLGFGRAEDGGQFFGLVGPGHIHMADFEIEYVAV